MGLGQLDLVGLFEGFFEVIDFDLSKFLLVVAVEDFPQVHLQIVHFGVDAATC